MENIYDQFDPQPGEEEENPYDKFTAPAALDAADLEVNVNTDGNVDNGFVEDVVKGGINGTIRAGQAVSDLMADAMNLPIQGYEAATGNQVDFRFHAPEPATFRTNMAGRITEGVTQFAWGYASGSGALRIAGWAKKGKPLLDWSRAMASGAIGDFISFTEEEERLSNLVQEFPALRNPVTEYLAADPNDNWAEGRLKNVLEGAGLGIATDAFLAGVRGLKNAKLLQAAGDEEGALKAIFQSKADAARILNGGEEIAADAVDDAVQAAVPKERFSPDEVKEIMRRITSGEGNMDAVSEAFNVQKWTTSDEGKQTLNEFVARLEATEPEAFTAVQTLKQTRNMAEDFLMNETDLRMAVADQVKNAEEYPAAVVALGIRTATIADQLPKLADHVAALLDAGDQEAIDAFMPHIDRAIQFFMDDVVNLKTLQKSAARTTGAGRIIKETIAPDQKVTPEQIVAIMEDFRGDKMGFLQNIARLNKKPSAVRRALSMVVDNKAWDILNEFWINSILSGPWTHVINASSNAIETAVKPLEGALGATFRGDRNAVRAELQTYTGLKHAFIDSFRMAKESFLTERNILDPVHAVNELNPYHAIRAGDGRFLNPDQHVITNGINLIGQVIRSPGRFMASTDEFFKQINYRARRYSDGYLEGLERGLKGQDLTDHALRNVDLGFDAKTGAALDENALQFARESTFTEDLGGYGLGSVLQAANAKIPALRQVLPFVRTPTNLIRHNIRRTPTFFLDRKAMADILGKNGPRAQSEQMARLAVGHSMIGVAALMASSGMIEGGAPRDPDLRREFFDSGRKEYAFKGPDGKYYSFNRLDPRFAIFGIVADITRNVQALSDEDQSFAAWLPVAALSFTNNLASKSYLKGLSETVEVMMSDNPDDWEKYFNWQVGSRVVPFSSLMRTVNPDRELKELRSIADGILANVPGLSGNVEAKRNVLGQKMEMGNPFISELNKSPVKQELYQLGEGFGLPPKRIPQTRIDMTNYKNAQGQSAYDRLQELTGTLTLGGKTLEGKLEELITGESYQRLPPLSDEPDFKSRRSERIQEVITKYRNRAMQQLRREYPVLDADIKTERRNLINAQRRGPEAIQPLLQSR